MVLSCRSVGPCTAVHWSEMHQCHTHVLITDEGDEGGGSYGGSAGGARRGSSVARASLPSRLPVAAGRAVPLAVLHPRAQEVPLHDH